LDLINKKINERLIIIKKNKNMENEKTNENNTDINRVMIVPYIRGISNGIKRIVKNCMDVRFTIPRKNRFFDKKG